MSICYVELDGEMVSRTEYCRRLGYNYVSIANMMSKYNLTFEEAVKRYLNTKRRIKFDDRMKDRRLRKKWRDMMDRCYNPKNPSYPYYGGRKPKSIQVCDRWHDYENFKADLWNSYIKHVKEYGKEETTLDRNPDKEGNYCPENCEWATRKEQANNRTTNIIVKETGETLAELSDRLHMDYHTVHNRYIQGWPIDKIASIPVRQHAPYTNNKETNRQLKEKLDAIFIRNMCYNHNFYIDNTKELSNIIFKYDGEQPTIEKVEDLAIDIYNNTNTDNTIEYIMECIYNEGIQRIIYNK